MVTCKEVVYENYGKCLVISNEKMEVYVTVDLGPRIIKCNLIGKENMLYNDITRKFSNDVGEFFGKGKCFYNYGGHRLWVSPESFPETYYPDNESVVYSVLPNGAVFSAPIQEKTGFKYDITVLMDSSDAKITVSHTITNTLDKDIECAAWALSVMDKNSVIVVPQPTHDTGLLANRSISLWPYTDMTDKRLFFGKKFVASKQDPEIENALKYGITNTAGKIAVFNHGTVFVKEYKSEHFDSVYPDFGVSTEVYANGDFTEAETLSPLKKISKGESITHVESWSLAEFDEKIEFTNDSLENLIGRIF